jgi:penicillin-binding protein 1C
MLPSAANAEVPSFAETKAAFRSSEARLLDAQGRLLHELRTRHKERALDWVAYEELSPAFIEALLHVEDKRFFSHSGVDSLALAGALRQAIQGEKLRGASTITMQLAKLLSELKFQNKQRSIWGKFRQARLAWELESSWSKKEIFEAYVNLVGFRGEQRGVSAAARAFFAKSVDGLTLRESFFLASLLQLPSASAKRVSERLCHFSIEKNLGECEEIKQWTHALLRNPKAAPRHIGLTPHLAQKWLNPNSVEVKLSLVAELQRFAIDLVEEQLQQLKEKNVRDAAVIAVENATGRVLVYVGGSGKFSASPHVDMALAKRQAGSTLKPFLYATAFERSLLQANSWLLDEPFELAMERGAYRPGNYDGGFQGPVRAREALASSLNIPAVRVYELVGGQSFHTKLERLGITGLKEVEHYGPSLALGTADISLLDLVNAYRTLANRGVWSPLRFTEEKSLQTKQAFTPKTAGTISAILADRDSRSLSFGWESVLSTPFPAAVKTGTSKDMRDNWCIGYTSDYTVGVWVGNAGGDPMWQVSGITGAAPIWRSLITKLQAGKQAKSFPPLPKEPASQFARAKFSRILYPQQGMILALDPDIPDSLERVPFEAEGEGSFFVNDQPAEKLWSPARGKHKISLRMGDKILDEVRIEVR